MLLLAGPALQVRADEVKALARAQEIVGGRCFLCHGARGEAASELFPRLAAQNAEYIAKQLANFKSGARKSDTMKGMAADLTPEDMRALGLFFSRQTSPPHSVSDPSLAEEGGVLYAKGGAAIEVSACAGCHGPRGHGSTTLPRLAGQVASYLETQLKQFGTRERTNDNAVMHNIAEKMTEREIQAVAEYLSTLD
ncbi:MAG: cytochrome c, class I [Betaproteobacteria bacterium SG8_39]|nr:MAG: cytochrome c, class I [Betaproteobacteria bacterium SG8_39]